MPKVNWDALLGGAADTGIKAFEAGSQAQALSREATRRENLDAFNMGEKVPILRMPIGGLGGMAKSAIEGEAGLAPEEANYGDFGSVGAIGAAPPVMPQGPPQGGLGDVASRQQAGGMTSQAGPGGPAQYGRISDADMQGQAWFDKLEPDRRKLAIEAANQADVTSRQKEMQTYLMDYRTELGKLRVQKAGYDAAEKIVQMRQTQMQHLVEAQDALLQQQELGGENPEVSAQIRKIDYMLDSYKKEILERQQAKIKAQEAGQLAASEARRHEKVLGLLGVQPELIDNYKNTYINGGSIGDAENIILKFLGQGLPARKQSGATSKGASRPSPRPLR